MTQTKGDLSELEKKLRYTFQNSDHLQLALTHSSYAYEQSLVFSNERMEFLGDAVLHIVLTEFLVNIYPSDDEGQLSVLRSYCESEPFLYERALELQIGSFISFGKGEIASGGRYKESLLADTMEAIIAAVYLDDGLEGVRNFILMHFKKYIIDAHENKLFADSKSELQKLCQKVYRTLPEYSVLSESGYDHDKTYEVQVRIISDKDTVKATGFGRNKKSAEKNAASALLRLL